MTDYISQLKSAIHAVQIHSATSFSWFGNASPRLLPRIERELSPRAARNFLQYMLQSRLYSHFYCTGWATPATDGEAQRRLTGVASFIERLSNANSGRGTWSDGWALAPAADLRPGIVAAQRNGLLLLAGQDEYREGVQPNTIALRFGKELPAESPGFYMAVGNLDLDTPLPPGAVQTGLVRFYWHLTPGGAIALMRHATAALNAARVPFKLKVLNDPDHYARCDSAVLYIQKHYYAQVIGLLGDIYPLLRADVHASVPALTHSLAPGLGLAEDPGGGESFGLHRCSLIADGLISAFEAGGEGEDARLDAVIGRFNEAMISMESPYLNQAGGWMIEPKLQLGADVGNVASALSHENSSHSVLESQEYDEPITVETAVGVAGEIATRLMSEALWHGGMCNWMGTELKVEGKGPNAGLRREEWATLGPDLYSGTAGVGLFLAEYAGVTHDAGARETAIAAFHHAFSKAESMPPPMRSGLYTGHVGIALAAARAAHILDEPELEEPAHSLMSGCASESHPGHEHDLLAGSAGAIVGSLALYRQSKQPYLLDFAIRHGDDLLSSAIKGRNNTLAWRTVNNKTAAPLTGFSHGASGIAYALLHLYRVTSDSRYRAAAEAAFRYEDQYFNTHIANWPDFRETAPTRGNHALPYAEYWCHGAPGIGIARLYAHSITGDSTYISQAEAALATTARSVKAEAASTGSSFSLCHGVLGNAAILQHGVGILDAESTRLPHTAARLGIKRRETDGYWACGAGISPAAYAPGLLLGVAGIGHFFLRLAHPHIPSVLMIEPDSFL